MPKTRRTSSTRWRTIPPALETKADVTRDMGDAKEEAIDDADVNAQAMTNAQKNEMTKAQ